MNYKKKKIIIGLIVVVVALLIGGLMFVALTGNIAATKTPVLVALQDIREGTEITEKMFTTSFINKDAVPEGAITSQGELKGQNVGVAMFTGDILTEKKLSQDDTINVNVLNKATENDKEIIALTIPNFAAGVSGTIQDGDVIRLIAPNKASGIVTGDTRSSMSREDGADSQSLGVGEPVSDEPGATTEAGQATEAKVTEEPTEEETKTGQSMVLADGELSGLGEKYFEIYRVTTSEGKTPTADPDTVGVDEAVKTPATVLLFCTREESEILAKANEAGDIQFVFVARGDARSEFVKTLITE